MAITTNAICNSFKKQLMGGEHDFDSAADTFKLAKAPFAIAFPANKALTVILLVAGVPEGSSTIRSRSSPEAAVSDVSSLTFFALSAI